MRLHIGIEVSSMMIKAGPELDVWRRSLYARVNLGARTYFLQRWRSCAVRNPFTKSRDGLMAWNCGRLRAGGAK